MAEWKTEETRTETFALWWRLVVLDGEGDARKDPDPTPADYIAALRAEPVAVRIAVMEGVGPEGYERLFADLAAVTAERDALRARLDGVATTDRETRAVLALVEWSGNPDNLRRMKRRIYGGYVCWPDYRDNDRFDSCGTALALCARLGIEVE